MIDAPGVIDALGGIDALGVRALLPHRYPILLVDRVLELTAGRAITAIKAVTLNEPWYARLGPDPAPDDLAYPGALLVESWAQSAGLLANSAAPAGDGPPPVMLFGSTRGVTFGRPVLPGDVLRHHARLTRVLEDTVFVEGESRVGDDVVLTVEQGVLAFRPAELLSPRTATPAGSTR